ncbi:MAG: rRNA adenine N-6-methyltransferase family protein [Nanoarchaeota archaeon]
MPKPHLITEFLHDSKVASVKSSSRFISKYICKRIDFSKNLTIVEYGPGNGVLTKEILKCMDSDSRIIAIETNEKLALFLKNIKDKRLIVVKDNAKNVENILDKLNIKKADYIISGVPFSMINLNDRNEIIRKTKDVLSNKGSFFVYQFRKDIEKDLDKYFSNIKKHYEIRNIPPLIIFECKK